MVDEVYFQGAELQDFVLNSGGTRPVHNTTSGYFNSSNARCAIAIATATDDGLYVETTALSLTEFWIRWNCRVVTGGTSATRFNFMKLYDADGTERLGLRVPADPGNTSFEKIAVYKSGSTLLGTSSAITSFVSTLTTFHLYVKLGNPGTVRIYAGTTLIFEDTALDLTWVGVTALDKIRLTSPGASASFITCYSEVGVTNWDTRNSFIATRVPDANGADNQWISQDYTILDDLTPTSFIAEDAIGDRMSYSLSSFPATGGGYVVESLKITADVRTDARKVPKPYVKIGATNYDAVTAGSIVRAEAATDRMTSYLWAKNPQTAIRWTSAVLNAMEAGLKSVKEPLGLVSVTIPASFQYNVAITNIDINAYGGTPSYTYTLTGSWPTGLSIDSSTGIISGTPTVAGSYPTLNVKVTDADGDEALLGADFSLSIAANWTPAQLGAAIAAWGRAKLLSGSNNDPISTFADQSGRGKDWTSSGGNRPLLQTAALNGNNTIKYNAASSHYFSQSPSVWTGAVEGSAFRVFKAVVDPAASTAASGFWRIGSSGNTCHMPWTDGNIYDDFGSNARKTTINPTLSLASAWRIYSTWSAPSDWGMRIDGLPASGLTGYATASNTVSFDASQQYLGQSYDGSSNRFYMDGQDAEILELFCKLSDADHDRVVGYLAHEHDLTANLDAGHTYKTTPPGAWVGWVTSIDAPPVGANNAGWSGYTMRQRIPHAQLSATQGSKIRISIKLGTAGATIGNAYIGMRAASGDIYDFQATPTQLFFDSGNAGGTFASNALIVTDELTFTMTPGVDLIISIYFSGNTDLTTGAASGWTNYFKLASDAATVNATGYTTAAGPQYGIRMVETFF